jgi:hypothetical protein
MNEEEKEEKLEKEEQKTQMSLTEALRIEERLLRKLEEEKRLLAQDLTDDERTVIDCFRQPRLLLERIYIIFNQTRKNLNLSLKTQTELREILTSLAEKKYIQIERFIYNGEEREAFILTEKGQEVNR